MSEIEHTPEVERVDEDSKKFNRQINFYIMRYMWQVIRKRGYTNENGNLEDIYDAFCAEPDTMSRGRYTRIVDGENVRISKNELSKWVEKTGLPGSVFTGDIRIECVQREKHGEQVSLKTITAEDWRELFDLRQKRVKAHGGKAYEIAKEDYSEKEKKIQAILKNAERQDEDHKEFSQLCYWLKNRKPAPANLQNERVRMIIRALSSLDFQVLDDCELTLLQNLTKQLKQVFEIANTIQKYKSQTKK